MALQSTSSLKPDKAVAFPCKVVNVATGTIQTHSELSQTDLALSVATDPSFPSLCSQDGRMLMRLLRVVCDHDTCPGCCLLDPRNRRSLHSAAYDFTRVDRRKPPPHHFDRLSETGLSKHLARTMRGIALAAGFCVRQERLKATAIAECSDSQTERSGQPPQALTPEQEDSSFLGDSLSDTRMLDTNSSFSLPFGWRSTIYRGSIQPWLMESFLDHSSSNIWDLTFGTG